MPDCKLTDSSRYPDPNIVRIQLILDPDRADNQRDARPVEYSGWARQRCACRPLLPLGQKERIQHGC